MPTSLTPCVHCCVNGLPPYAGGVTRKKDDPPATGGPAQSELFRAPVPTERPALAELPALSLVKQRLVDAAVAIRQDQAEDITYQHSIFCQTALPVRHQDTRVWERRQGRALLRVEAGTAVPPGGNGWVELPLPYGPKARLVMMHLNSEAIRTQSPVIEVENTLTAFVRRVMSGPNPDKRRDPNGREIRMFKEQLAALSAATVRLAVVDEERSRHVTTQIVGAFDLWFPKDSRQRVLWNSTVHLSQDYFNSLLGFAVPLDERAIASLAHSALALDVYAWLAQRLHRIPAHKPQFVPWTALHEQFGQGYSKVRQFRAFFLRVLAQVQVAYPDARFSTDAGGMHLEQSAPPISKRLIATRWPGIERPETDSKV